MKSALPRLCVAFLLMFGTAHASNDIMTVSPDVASRNPAAPSQDVGNMVRVTDVDSLAFPRLSMNVSLLASDGHPLCGLSKKSFSLAEHSVPLQNPPWGQEMPLPLDKYIHAPAPRTQVLSVETIPAREEDLSARIVILFTSSLPMPHLSSRFAGSIPVIADRWFKSLPNAADIRFAALGTNDDLQSITWLTPWLKRRQDAKQELIFDGKTAEYGGANGATIGTAVTAIWEEINKQTDIRGPSWIIVVSPNDDDSSPDVLSYPWPGKTEESHLLQHIIHFSPFLDGISGSTFVDLRTRQGFIVTDDVVPKIAPEIMGNRIKAYFCNHYRVKWFDADFRQTSPRQYAFTFNVDGRTARTAKLQAIVKKETISALFNDELQAIHEIWREGDLVKLHAAIASLLQRYPVGELEPFFRHLLEEASVKRAKRMDADILDLVKRIESIYGKKPNWRVSFREAYQNLGDGYRKENRLPDAASCFERSIHYEPTSSVYASLLDCQLSLLDYDAAQRSAEWLYAHVSGPGKSSAYVQNMAFAYGAGMKFIKSERLLRRSLMGAKGIEHLWNYAILSLKGIWYGSAAAILASVHSREGMPSSFDEALKDLKGMEDIRWIGVVSPRGIIRTASADNLVGKHIGEVCPWMKHVAMERIRQPVFLSDTKEANRIGIVAAPVGTAERPDLVVICFDTTLDLKERTAFANISNHPSDDGLWSEFKSVVYARRGTVAAKTAGAAMKKMKLTKADWPQRVAAMKPLFPEEIMAYLIVAGRKAMDGSVETLVARPEKGIPADIAGDVKANTNPYFMYQTKTFSGKPIHEFTTAVNAGTAWMGVLRIGYNW